MVYVQMHIYIYIYSNTVEIHTDDVCFLLGVCFFFLSLSNLCIWHILSPLLHAFQTICVDSLPNLYLAPSICLAQTVFLCFGHKHRCLSTVFWLSNDSAYKSDLYALRALHLQCVTLSLYIIIVIIIIIILHICYTQLRERERETKSNSSHIDCQCYFCICTYWFYLTTDVLFIPIFP